MDDIRCQEGGHKSVATRIGKFVQNDRWEAGTGACRLRFNQRRISGDFYLFVDRTDLQRDIERRELLRADTEAGLFEGLESRQSRADFIGARRHKREGILPDFV